MAPVLSVLEVNEDFALGSVLLSSLSLGHGNLGVLKVECFTFLVSFDQASVFVSWSTCLRWEITWLGFICT